MYTSLAGMSKLNTVMVPLTNHAKQANVAGLHGMRRAPIGPIDFKSRKGNYGIRGLGSIFGNVISTVRSVAPTAVSMPLRPSTGWGSNVISTATAVAPTAVSMPLRPSTGWGSNVASLFTRPTSNWGSYSHTAEPYLSKFTGQMVLPPKTLNQSMNYKSGVAGLGFDFDFGALTSNLIKTGTDIGTSLITSHYAANQSHQALPSPAAAPLSSPQIVYMQPGGVPPAPAPAPVSHTGTYIAIGAGVAALAVVALMMKRK